MSAPHELEPGDIVLVSRGDPLPPPKDAGAVSRTLWNAGQAVFRAVSPRLQGSLTHAMIYTGDGKIVESTKEGIVERPFRAATLKKAYVVMRPEVPKKFRHMAANFARKQIGKPYDDTATLAAGASLFLPEPVAEKVLTSVVEAPKSPKSWTAFQCAGLVTASYEAAGVEAPANSIHWRFAAPAHLLTYAKNRIVMKKEKGQELKEPSMFSRLRGSVRERLSKTAVQAFWEELEKIANVVVIPNDRAKEHGSQPVTPEELAEFKARCTEAKLSSGDGCSLGKDKDGFYAYTHRARSNSYPRPGAIPLAKIRFVGSTA